MLEELYQQVILDHSRAPRNATPLPVHSHQAHGHNPLCGDECWCTLELSEDTIKSIGIKSVGCAISVASASLLTEVVQQKTLTEVQQLFDAFHLLLTKGKESAAPSALLGKCAILAGVQKFPIRIKCATLPWHTLKAALAQHASTSTEETPP